MKKVFTVICLILTISSCVEKKKCQYKSAVMQRFDLRGNVKSIETNAFFEDMIDLCNFCNSEISHLEVADLKTINFSDHGYVELVKGKNRVDIYDETGKIIRKSFRNNEGVEYGYSNFTYYPNCYYNINRYYEIDSTRHFTDTIMVIERGTRDKYYKGIDPVGAGIPIHKTYVLDKNGYVLEKMFVDIQSSIYKYKYDTFGRLTSKVETYQGFKIDSLSFDYTADGYLQNCTNKFEFRNFDKCGNWQKLIIKGENKKIEISRKINYY